jgi:hypothetical protein
MSYNYNLETLGSITADQMTRALESKAQKIAALLDEIEPSDRLVVEALKSQLVKIEQQKTVVFDAAVLAQNPLFLPN